MSRAAENAGVDRSSFYKWLDDDAISSEEREQRNHALARSKQEGADARFDNIVELTEEMIDAVKALDSDDRRASAIVNAYNNKIHAEKWVLKILHPERYNEAVRVEASLRTQLSFTDFARLAR